MSYKSWDNKPSGGRPSTKPPATGSNVLVQDPYLNILRKYKAEVTVHMVDNSQQIGVIDSFDRTALLLSVPMENPLEGEEGDNSLQLIYKDTIVRVVSHVPVTRRGALIVVAGDESTFRPKSSPQHDQEDDYGESW